MQLTRQWLRYLLYLLILLTKIYILCLRDFLNWFLNMRFQRFLIKRLKDLLHGFWIRKEQTRCNVTNTIWSMQCDNVCLTLGFLCLKDLQISFNKSSCNFHVVTLSPTWNSTRLEFLQVFDCKFGLKEAGSCREPQPPTRHLLTWNMENSALS